MTSAAGGAATYYLYDGEAPLLELNGAGQVQAANGAGTDGWRQRYYPGAYPGGPAGNAWGGQYYAYTFDPQGSLVQRQRQGNGASDATDTLSFDAYGKRLGDVDAATGATETYSDPVGFGGQFGYQTDRETGLSLLTHRYYDAGAGRFLSRDPAGYGGGMNLYGYAGNNPVNEQDPSGLDWLDDTSNFSAGAGDIISGGLTRTFRQHFGYDGIVDKQSGAYHGGQITGVGYLAVDAVVGGVGVVNGVRAIRAAGGLGAAIDAVRATRAARSALASRISDDIGTLRLSMPTRKGLVNFSARATFRGKILYLDNVSIYSASGQKLSGLTREMFQLKSRINGEAKIAGFKYVRVRGFRTPESSANPGHVIDELMKVR